MSPKFNILLLIFFSFACCQNKEEKRTIALPQTVSTLLNEAENSKLPLQERLVSALKADSLAKNSHDRQTQVVSQRIIATIYLKQGNNEFAKIYFSRVLELARAVSDEESQGAALSNLGIIFSGKGNYDSSLKYYSDANQVFRKIGDQLRVAQNLVNMGIAYKNQGNFEEGFRVSLEAANIFDSLKRKKDLASAYTNMGNVLKELKNYADALNYHQLALQLRKDEHDSVGIAVSMNNIGKIFQLKNENKKALSYYFQSLELKERLGNPKALVTTIDNIAEVYTELIDYKNAEVYLIKALDLQNDTDNLDGFLTTSNLLSKLYLQKNELKKAEKIALIAFNKSPNTGFLYQRYDNNIILFEIYRKLGNGILASNYASNAFKLKDDLSNSEMTAAISKMQTKYKTEQTEKELSVSKQIQTVQSNQIRKQLIFILILGLLLLALIYTFSLLYHSYKKIKTANQRIEFLMSELNHRVKNNFQLISDLLHLQKDTAKDQEQKAFVQTSINRIQSVQVVHSLLYKKDFDGTISMQDFIKELVANLSFTYESISERFDILFDIFNIYIDVEKAIFIGLVINELITNIYKYSQSSKDMPTLAIAFSEDNNNYKLQIKDNCDSWDIQQGRTTKSGLGLFLVENLIKQLKGNWDSFRNDGFTLHSITFRK